MKVLLKYFPILLLFIINVTYGHNDINLTENKGQWPAQVNFKTDVLGGKIWLEKNKISYQFTKHPNLHVNFESREKAIVRQHVVWAEFIGVNDDFNIVKQDKSSHYSNYFIGNDESKWATYAYSYGDIKYLDFYDNVDFRMYEQEGHLKYDFIIKSGGENNIKIRYQGQNKIKLNKNNELVIYTNLGEIIEEKPYAYQIIDGIKVEVPCKFSLIKNHVSFLLGAYDKSIELIIDPVLVFASYNGSPSDNFGMTATYDEDGNLYTGGTIYGAQYPTTAGAYDQFGTFATVFPQGQSQASGNYGVTDVFITKYEPNGTSLIYSTYLGGGNASGGTETVNSLICDSLGNLHLYGNTSSSDFPITPTAYQNTLMGGNYQQFFNNGHSYWDINHVGGGTDIFVTKFNATGSAILGSTFIGGTKNDGLNYNTGQGNYSNPVAAYDSLTNNYGDQSRGEIMIDDLGFIYITSSTYSPDFPIVGGFQSTIGGLQDAVVCKFSPNLDNLIWSSFLGGTEKDAGYSIKLTANKDVVIAGGTCSSDFPATAGTINPTYQGGITDGYITKIDKNGGSILASTFIGDTLYDQCFFVEIDRFGSIYTTGQSGGGVPIINAAYSDPNSSNFIMKMDSNLTAISYSTVFGNGNVNAEFSPTAFLVDRCQNVYVSGWGGNILGGSPLTGMPITTNSIQSAAGDNIPTTSGDGYNFYLTVLERNMQSQLFGIYYGSPNSQDHIDGGTSRFDKNGIIYQSVCAGCGGDSNFPTTTGAYSNINGTGPPGVGNCNNGVFKFDFELIPTASFSVDTFQGCAPLTVTFTNTTNSSDSYLWDFGGGDTTSQILNPVKTYATPGTYFVTLLIQDSICNTIDTAFQTILVGAPITVTGGNTITTCDDTATFFISTTGGPTSFIWSTNNQFTNTLNPNPTDSSLFVTVTDTTWFYVMATNGPCSAIDSFLFNYTGFKIQLQGDTICQGNTTTLNLSTISNQTINYNWTPTGSIVSGANTSNPIVNPSSTTTYIVTAQNSFGCIVTDSLLIAVVPPITISGGDTTTTCDTTTLEIFTTGGPTVFIWSTNNQFTDTLNPNLTDTSLFVTATDTSWFYVMASNGHCTAIDSFLVNYTGFAIQAPDGAVCSGKSDTLEIITQSNQTITYSWTPTGSIVSGANTPNPIVNPSSTTTYIVTAQNSFGCTVIDSATVFVSSFDPSNINIWADQDTLYDGQGTLIHVTPSSGFTYSWTPPSFLNNPNIANPYATPGSTITYTVTLTENSSGCSFPAYITLYVFEILCGEPDVFIPNAFTPNNDNENDVLFVRGRNVEEMVLKIYDRWGELVFETDKQSKGWDGTYKGALVDPAVFVYYLQVLCIDGQKYFKKGNVTVIR